MTFRKSVDDSDENTAVPSIATTPAKGTLVVRERANG